MKRRLAVGAVGVTAALLTMLLLAEGGLRLAQHIVLSKRDQNKEATAMAGGSRVLALGDSWTYGMESGDPARLSYPAQLQRMLNRGQSISPYRVINRGKPGLSSRHLVSALPAQLKQYAPDILLVMVGPANFFQTMGATSIRWYMGPLEHSRVLAVIRLLMSPVGSHFAPPSPQPVKDDLAKVVQEGPREVGQRIPPGTPAPGTVGCSGQHLFKPLEPLLDAAMGQKPEEMSKVLGAGAGCLRILTLSAEFCLERSKGIRALYFAQKALALAPRDPRSRVALARALLLKEKKWSVRMQRILREVVKEYPKFTRAWRQLTLAELTLEPTLCSVRGNIIRAAEACPGCAWVKAADTILERQVSGPGRMSLQADLADIALRARMAGTRLLLLNFPPIEGDFCSDLARQAVTGVAVDRDIKILDLDGVLGTFHVEKAARPEHYGAAHPNAEGYRLIAQEVYEKLKELGWIPHG